MNADALNRIAETDRTFTRIAERWVGKCLICNGPIAFDSATGEGATVEHIIPRALGGDNDPLNLGVAHFRCNAEKGRHWDARRRHSHRAEQYAALTERLLAERARRYRTPRAESAPDEPAKRSGHA